MTLCDQPARVDYDQPTPRTRRRRPARAALSDAQRDFWSRFGSAATDNQRINLRLATADGHKAFFNAEAILDGNLATALARMGTIELSARLCESLAAAAAVFLEAAEQVVAVHRTRLHLALAAAQPDAQRHRVVLEWRDRASPALESIPLDDFSAGRWNGLMRSQHPGYSTAIATMMRSVSALAVLRSQFDGLQTACLAIRTFDPPQ